MGIKTTEIEEYAEKIISIAKNRQPIKIPRKGTYLAVLEHPYGYETIAIFRDGEMRCGGWTSPLQGDLYVVGRYGYVKFEGKEGVYRERLTPPHLGEIYVSRIQLLVRPKENEIEILDVGLNPVKILSEEEFIKWKKEKEKEKSFRDLWIFFIIGLTGLSLLLLLFSSSLQPALFILPNSSNIVLFLTLLFLIGISQIILKISKNKKLKK